MSKSRLLAGLILLQLLSLLTITQSWYQVSMKVNGSDTKLGDFDGVTSYPLSMTLALFGLAAMAVAVLSRNKRWGVGIASAVNLTLAIMLAFQVAHKNISALDSQLDRLTGIAKTHGLDTVSVEITLFPWISILLSTIIALAGGYLALTKWPASDIRYTAKTKGAADSPTDAIGIWDQQRP